MREPRLVTNASTPDIQHTLDAWREQGQDRRDPVRFQLIQTMATRAASISESTAKRALNRRLDQLVQQYQALLDTMSASAVAAPPKGPHESALTPLLAGLTTRTPAESTDTLASNLGNLRERYPELPVLDEFRAVWSRVSVNRQVRQSEEQVHQNAGPLNSNHLVHRTLAFMRDVSPGYLHQFLSYMDTLAWVEQLQIDNAPPAKETKRAASKTPRKSAARKTTKKAV